MQEDNITDTEVYSKINDYTLRVTIDFGRQDRADPELSRIFNFKAQQVTHIFSQWYNSSVANSMTVQNFSDLDSFAEIAEMRERLIDLGGRPPPLPDASHKLGKPAITRPRER